MFAWHSEVGSIEIAITQREIDLVQPADLEQLNAELGLGSLAVLNQVHGSDVVQADATQVLSADAQFTAEQGLGLLVRVADCVPVVLAAPGEDLIAVAHAGREGVIREIVPRTLAAFVERGATSIEAWIGPHICGACYELPVAMADEVASVVPEARSTTSWGTPAADLGRAVAAQLEAHGASVHLVPGCTREDPRFFSHRRGDAGRFGAVVVRR